MQIRTRPSVILLGLLLSLATCTLLQTGDQSNRPLPAPTGANLETASPSPPTPTAPMPLRASTDPFENAVGLLDGVCFEFLLSLHGETWVWMTPQDLYAFYARADASESCESPIARSVFEFDDRVLVGTVDVATGCDAAHHVRNVIQDDATRSQVLELDLEVTTGCNYELVEPFLVAMPRPPEGYTLEVVTRIP